MLWPQKNLLTLTYVLTYVLSKFRREGIIRIPTLVRLWNELHKQQPVIRLPVEYLQYTVEPPNRGHFGTAAFVLSSEVVLFSEVV